MPGEDNDLSSRFDYLFEPLDERESADDTIDAVSPASEPSDDETPSRSAAPLRLGSAAFVLATLGAVAVVAMLLLQRPNEPVDAPLDPAPRSTTEPNAIRPAGPSRRQPRGGAGRGVADRRAGPLDAVGAPVTAADGPAAGT